LEDNDIVLVRLNSFGRDVSFNDVFNCLGEGMSTLICEKDFNVNDSSRGRMIAALRTALNAAEQGENEVSITYNTLEITWNYSDGEFFVIG